MKQMKDKLFQKKAVYKVVILQRVLPHYRIAFFSRLYHLLKNNGISLSVLYGDEYSGTVPRTVHPEEEWAVYIKNRYIRYRTTEIVWQGCLAYLRNEKPDLVIIEQANRLLVNYLLLSLRVIRRLKLAYWGHGCNFQSDNRRSIREFIKLHLIKSVDWWFAYTKLSATIVENVGYSHKKITIVQNSIDTDKFKQSLTQTGDHDICELKSNLGIESENIALFCGGMYPDKKLPFLLESAVRIRSEIDDFNLILIGNGPDEHIARNMSEQYQWVHFVGGVFGDDRAAYFLMSELLLMPGLVGLAIVDSFIALTPMVTTDIPIHSPEISYLEHGKNGVMTSFDIDEYVSEVVSYLSDKQKLGLLQKGCEKSAEYYTLEHMVKSYSEGVINCLQQ